MSTTTATRRSARSRRDLRYRVVKSHDFRKVVKAIETGIPFRRLTEFERRSGLSQETIARVIRTPSRTLARRKASGRLKTDESERLHRLSVLFEQAVELFEGDEQAARQWLESPKRAFAGETPLRMAETEVGAREVEDLIGRLEHGVFT